MEIVAERLLCSRSNGKSLKTAKKEGQMKILLRALGVLACMAVGARTARADEEIKNPFFLDYQRSASRGFEEFRADWCYTSYSQKFPAFFSCVNARHGYGAAYLGPEASFRSVRVGAGVGFEAQDGEEVRERYAAFVRGERGRIFFYGLVEAGGGLLYRKGKVRWEQGEGDMRYRAEVDCRVTAIKFPSPTPMDISLGALYENEDGVGPRLKVKIPNMYTEVWVASLYHVERKEMNYVMGMHVIFF